jgi:hypothetical protein
MGAERSNRLNKKNGKENIIKGKILNRKLNVFRPFSSFSSQTTRLRSNSRNFLCGCGENLKA